MIPATAVPLKGCPFLEIMAKQTAPTPQMIATWKAKQQSVKRAKIPLIREIVAKEFFSRLGRCGLVLPVGRLSVIVLILPIRRLPVLRWELAAVLLILPVWILSWMLRRNLPAVLWNLPVWIMSRILRRNLSAILLILPVRILSRILRRNLSVILGWILLIRLCRIWILRNISGAVWILICGRCFLVHIFIFR